MTGDDAREAALRSDAVALAAAAVAACDPGRLVAPHVRSLRDGVEVAGARFEVAPGGLRIVAAGKAAAAMAQAAVDALRTLDPTGVVVVPTGSGAGPAELATVFGEHPVPGPGSVSAALRVGRILDEAGPGDLVLLLLSGGASSLIGDVPGPIDRRAYARAVDVLQCAGASVFELNALRRRLGDLKCGRAVLRAWPATVIALLVSDVVGSDPATIGSGLTVGWSAEEPDPEEVARALGVLDDLPSTVRQALHDPGAMGLEPPPSRFDPRLAGAISRIVGDNGTAIDGVAAWAHRLGYSVRRLKRPVVGTAREAGARLGRMARRAARLGPSGRGWCIVGGGETVVRVAGSGLGGRNQELAAGAVVELDGLEAVCLCSLGTDGVDGPTPAAGALATGSTADRAAALGLSVRGALDDNDTYHLFDRLDDLLITGPTGTNVMDVQIMLLGEP